MQTAFLLVLLFTANPESVTARDLDVWRVVLTSLQKERGDFQLIGETASGVNLSDWKLDDRKSIPREAVDDSQRRNTIIEFGVDPKVAGVTFLPHEKWAGADWKKANVKLALPGYTKDGRTAVMLATHSVGTTNWSILYVMRNEKGKWQITFTRAQPFYVIVS